MSDWLAVIGSGITFVMVGIVLALGAYFSCQALFWLVEGIFEFFFED